MESYGPDVSRAYLMEIKEGKKIKCTRREREKNQDCIKNLCRKLRGAAALSYFFARDIELKIYVLYTPTVLNTFIERTRASFNLPLTLKILRVF